MSTPSSSNENNYAALKTFINKNVDLPKFLIEERWKKVVNAFGQVRYHRKGEIVEIEKGKDGWRAGLENSNKLPVIDFIKLDLFRTSKIDPYKLDSKDIEFRMKMEYKIIHDLGIHLNATNRITYNEFRRFQPLLIWVENKAGINSVGQQSSSITKQQDEKNFDLAKNIVNSFKIKTNQGGARPEKDEWLVYIRAIKSALNESQTTGVGLGELSTKSITAQQIKDHLSAKSIHSVMKPVDIYFHKVNTTDYAVPYIEASLSPTPCVDNDHVRDNCLYTERKHYPHSNRTFLMPEEIAYLLEDSPSLKPNDLLKQNKYEDQSLEGVNDKFLLPLMKKKWDGWQKLEMNDYLPIANNDSHDLVSKFNKDYQNLKGDEKILLLDIHTNEFYIKFDKPKMSKDWQDLVPVNTFKFIDESNFSRYGLSPTIFKEFRTELKSETIAFNQSSSIEKFKSNYFIKDEKEGKIQVQLVHPQIAIEHAASKEYSLTDQVRPKFSALKENFDSTVVEQYKREQTQSMLKGMAFIAGGFEENGKTIYLYQDREESKTKIEVRKDPVTNNYSFIENPDTNRVSHIINSSSIKNQNLETPSVLERTISKFSIPIHNPSNQEESNNRSPRIRI